MDTRDFFTKVLPDQGIYVLAVFKWGMDKYPKHSTTTDKDVLAKAALLADKQGYPTYFAVHSFAEKRQKKMRVAGNVAWVRSQVLDIDVGRGKDYATRKEAIEALKSACKQLGIPAPVVVGSGGLGLHCYWVFNQDVAASVARPCAVAFSDELKRIGFRHDTTRTADLASVLRPIGTHNRKTDPPVEVQLLKDAKVVDWEKWSKRFNIVTAPEPVGMQDADDFMANVTKFTDYDAVAVAKRCKVVHTAWKAHGDVEEPYWFRMLGLLKHSTGGEALAHKWSSGSPQYSKEETQEKLDNWAGGPPSCETMECRVGACDGCPHKGKISGPKVLGEISTPKAKPAKKQKPKQLVKFTSDDQYAFIEPDDAQPQKLPFFDHTKYDWDGEILWAIKEDVKSGDTYWQEISATLYYPFLRFETEEHTRAMMVCALADASKNLWRTFEIETTKVAESQALAYALGSHEVLYMPTTKDLNRQYVQDMLYGLRESGVETTTYNTFGWHDDGFVIGKTKYTKAGPQPVYLGSKVPNELNKDFGRKGTAIEWADIIDQVYNRPGAEPYQFAIACGFGSPLIKLTEASMYHGISVAYTGDSGKGKSTVGKVACSMYGEPESMMIAAGPDGTTMNALIQRISTMRNLPLVLDEVTGRDHEELQALLFAMSNGKPKLRLRSDGSEINANQSWDTFTFVTGNINITKMLAEADRTKAEATQVRCFEIPLDDAALECFRGINAKDLIEGQLLANQYGEAGRAYLEIVMQNRAKITKRLLKKRSSFVPLTSDDTKERFYYDTIAVAMEGAKIAKAMGLIKFDLDKLEAWAINHIQEMRSSRVTSHDTPEDHLQSFLGAMFLHTITTKYYRDGRQKMHNETCIESIREPLARKATEDRRYLVTHKAFKDWCIKHNVDIGWFTGQLVKLGYLKNNGTDVRHRICRGTTMTGTQARCLEFDYDMIDSQTQQRPDYMSLVEDTEK